MRGIPAAVLTEIGTDAVEIVSAVELDFSSGVARFCDADYDVQINGDTYQGIGSLGQINVITEDRSLTSPGLIMRLSGIDSTVMSATLDEEYFKRSASVHLQFQDGDNDVIGDYTPWSGVMSEMALDVSDGIMSIGLTCESRLAITNGRPSLRTQERQQQMFSGDTFFDYLSQLEQTSVTWGQNSVNSNATSSPVRLGADGNRLIP